MYHYRSHAGIKPFSCTVCEATFTRQHSLNYHMLIHNNKSRFVCGDCGRNFRHPSHYKEHLRRHTGETPYECTDCNLRFKTRNTYKRHLKTRHGKILTAQGIRLLSVEEFRKVRTSPRKRPSKSGSNHKRDQETQWPEIMYPESDFYF
ncbi:Zinc finger protein 628, partial [Stegodyphus mimosarum]